MSVSAANLTETCCRICLTNCSCSATNISDVAELFYQLVGYKIFTSDLPKKICGQCLENLVLLKSFKETCDESEKFLQQLRQNEATKDEVVVKIEPDSEIFVKDEGCEAFLLEEPPSETFLDSKESDLNEKTTEIKSRPSRKGMKYRKKGESKVIQKTAGIKSRPSRKGMKYRKKGDPTPKETKRKSKYVKKNKVPREEKVICELCGIRIRKDFLHAHIKTTHEKVWFECDLCGIKSKTKLTLERHITADHLKIDPFPCQECGKNFKYKEALTIHVKRMHTINPPTFPCDLCDRSFRTQFMLRNHKATHSDLRSVQCPQCPARFQNLTQLSDHRHRKHPTRTFPCPDCGKIIRNKQLFTQHKRSHLPHAYYCPVCPASYAMCQTLRKHVYSKHPEYEMPPLGTVLSGVDINELKQKMKGDGRTNLVN